VKTLPEGIVEEALGSLGVEITEIRADELVAQCPAHKDRTGKEDSNPSWSINARTGVHFCFSCGFRGNLYTLTRDLGDETSAKRMLSEYERLGHVSVLDGSISLKAEPMTPLFVPSSGERIELSESKVSRYEEPPDWALNRRRILAEGARIYGVRWNPKRETWILPLRWPDNFRLMGVQEKGEKTRYFHNRPKSVPKAETLFGIDTVQDSTEVVVVESPLDAVLLSDLGYPAVAICGGKVSAEQAMILMELFDRVFFWLDNDDAGKTETERLRKLHMRMGAVNFRFLTPDTEWKDPGDTPYRHIDRVLRSAGL